MGYFSSLAVVWKVAYWGVEEAKKKAGKWKESLMHQCALVYMTG